MMRQMFKKQDESPIQYNLTQQFMLYIVLDITWNDTDIL